MSIGWLKRLFAPDARIDIMTEQLGELRSEVATLGQRVSMAERDARETAIFEAARQRRVAALARAMRVIGKRLDTLASRVKDHDGRGNEAGEAIARLRASLLALTIRVEAEADDTRRIATALLERIAANNPPDQPG